MKYFILILFSFATLYANSYYIKVADVKSKTQLRTIKSKLNSLGLKMIFKKSSHYYSVYLGPYKAKKQTHYVYKKIKRYFPSAKLLTSLTKKQSKMVEKQNVMKYYTALTFNYSLAPLTRTKIEGNVEISEPKNTGLSVSFEGGMDLPYNLSMGAGFSQFSTGDLIFSNFYGVVNYKFNTYKLFEPSFGVILGYSSLKWNTDPIANPSKDSSNDSTSPYCGTQVGVSYKGLKYVDLFVAYKYLYMQQATTIQVDTINILKLQYTMLHSIGLGVKYKF